MGKFKLKIKENVLHKLTFHDRVANKIQPAINKKIYKITEHPIPEKMPISELSVRKSSQNIEERLDFDKPAQGFPVVCKVPTKSHGNYINKTEKSFGNLKNEMEFLSKSTATQLENKDNAIKSLEEQVKDLKSQLKAMQLIQQQILQKGSELLPTQNN